MGQDAAGKAWQAIARDLAGRLPGEWRTVGTGIRTLLVREPLDWVVVWVGTSRLRRDDPPYLMGGECSFVAPPYTLSKGHGLRSDERRDAPRQVDPSAQDAASVVESFVVDDVVPRVAPWTAERLAEEAEHQLSLPMEERGRPLCFLDAPGWRVVLSDGSPENPAEQALAWWRTTGEQGLTRWYEDLLGAWRAGGRPDALRFLEDHRAAAWRELKLV